MTTKKIVTIRKTSQSRLQAKRTRYRFLNPRPKCPRGHSNVEPESRQWDGEAWVCLTCGVRPQRTEADELPAELTIAILDLQEKIENETLAYRKAALKEQMRDLLLQARRR